MDCLYNANWFPAIMARALLVSMCTTSSFAASSPWFNTNGAKIRLISLPSSDGKFIKAGLQIELDKGWKTYWRAPGASGLPPQISFSESANTSSTRLRFPVPSTFGDETNLTAGYLESVILPIDVKPLYSGRPTTLKATGVLGICGTVCVPVQFALSLTEDGKGLSTPDIASAILKSRYNLIGAPRDDFKIESVEARNGTKKELHIIAKVPKNTKSSTLFPEGPDNWYLTPVKAHKIDADTVIFKIDINDIPPEADPTATKLALTLVADGKGIAQEFTPKN